MPDTLFRVRWPDGGVETCYSPSTIIKTYYELGRPYALAEFLEQSRAGLHAASERVRERYGMSCARAMAQLDAIEARAKAFQPDAAPVLVEAFSG